MDAFTSLIFYSSVVWGIVFATIGIAYLSDDNKRRGRVDQLEERLREIRTEKDFYIEEEERIRSTERHYKEDSRYQNAERELKKLGVEEKKIRNELTTYGKEITVTRQATEDDFKRVFNPYGVRDLSKEKKQKD